MKLEIVRTRKVHIQLDKLKHNYNLALEDAFTLLLLVAWFVFNIAKVFI